MDLSTSSVLAAKAYKYKAESLVKDYLLADSYVSFTAVLGGILMCKMVLSAPFYVLALDIHDQPTCEFIRLTWFIYLDQSKRLFQILA
jgi:hypothetical protein